jgi:branched-chain amino acid transport system ATP-binding protein/urea transport system ATP-binding protein
MSNGEMILETRQLAKQFGGVAAVKGVDFRLSPGELRCIIGPNGAGKSTFFKLLTGQLGPSAGQIIFDGKDISGAEPYEISQLGISIKNQVPTVFDGLTVMENFWLAACRKHSASECEQRVEMIMDELQLNDLRNELVGELAHGQRQWVELGMVFGFEPKLCLLDEPTAGMSEEETERTARLISDASRTAAIVVVEHDMKFIQEIAEWVTVFHQGEIIVEDTMANIQSNSLVRDIYLGR